MKMYYTFGRDERYPYCGGWVEVEAYSMTACHKIFRMYFPDKTPGVLNCADFYTEGAFHRTEMPLTGNYDAGCYAKFTSRPDGVHFQLCDWRVSSLPGHREMQIS